jgi:alkyl hydroperoxide reductase subunit F
LRADAVLVAKLKSLPNVRIVTQAQTTEITGDGSQVNGLRYTDRGHGESHAVPLEGVFVQIGLVPNTDWLQGTLELSRHGEIVVDARGPDLAAGRVCRRRRDHGAVQADRHRGGRGRQGRPGAFDHLVRLNAFERHGANCICVCQVADESQRLAIVDDMVAGHQPYLNN